MKKACEELQKLIVMMEYNEISQEEKEKIQEHLKDCPECEKYAQEISRMKEYCNQYTVPPVPLPEVILPEKQKEQYRSSLIMKRAVFASLIMLFIAFFLILNKPGIMYKKSLCNKNSSHITALKENDITTDLFINLDFYKDHDLFNNIDLLNTDDVVASNTEDYI